MDNDHHCSTWDPKGNNEDAEVGVDEWWGPGEARRWGWELEQTVNLNNATKHANWSYCGESNGMCRTCTFNHDGCRYFFFFYIFSPFLKSKSSVFATCLFQLHIQLKLNLQNNQMNWVSNILITFFIKLSRISLANLLISVIHAQCPVTVPVVQMRIYVLGVP